MPRPLVFNFFVMNTPSHMTHGTWRMPGSKNTKYTDLETWVDLAKLAEAAKVDGIFFADVLGLYAPQNDDWGSLARLAIQFPVSDPAVVISAMAYATKELSFCYTTSVLQTHPFIFARSCSTLDHLTKGRVGWNIVCGASKNGSKSMGLPDVTDHVKRYAWAEEFVDVTYKLWEGSWDPDAVVRDTVNCVYTDPKKVHKINHVSERYSVEGPHVVEPSPQRVPVLFSAGASGPGVTFNARHAEASFLISGPPEAAGKKVAALTAEAIKAGRRAEDLHFIEGVFIIVGETDEDAARKEAEYESYIDDEAQALMVAGATGIDLSKFTQDTPLEELLEVAPGMKGGILIAMDTVKGRPAVLRDLFRSFYKNMRLVGSPQTVADKMEAFHKHGITGFNIISMVLPGTYEEFCNLLAPELKKRGLMQTEYTPGTLREKMFPGSGPWISDTHPAAKYRYRYAEAEAKA